jgi:hypothetical protein
MLLRTLLTISSCAAVLGLYDASDAVLQITSEKDFNAKGKNEKNLPRVGGRLISSFIDSLFTHL